ncbi:MAG: hypothetical protein IT204_24455 [Fimbriimonadaceae bacterium]|nr:hypothetical protein [Fimbriimonadaceae bacterium]
MSYGSSYRRAFDAIFQPRNIGLFLVATVALNFATSAAYDLLRNSLGPDVGRLWWVLLASILAVVLLVCWLRRLAVPREQMVIHSHAAPSARRGLICLFGRSEVVEQSLRHHSGELERVWLLTSLRDLPEAQRLAAEQPDLGWAQPFVLNDLYSPSAAFAAVNQVLDNLPEGWTNADLVGDFTGLTAQCSVGLVLACLNREVALQYTPAALDKDGKANGSMPPIETRLDFVVATEEAPVTCPAPSG